MSLTLILVRHAKSDHPAGLDDHERPLNDRGRRDAPRIGAWLAERDHVPDLALCSTAKRAVETWEGLRQGGIGAPVEHEAKLYHAAPDVLRWSLAGRSEAALMIVAHNPGIGLLARQLAQSAPDHPRFDQYPTCAATVLRFEADDWAGAVHGTGSVVDFVVPRDLPG